MPRFGIRGATFWAAGANLFTVIAGMGALAALRRRGVEADEAPVPEEADPEAPGGRSFTLWVALYASSGFCALALELLWFRILDVAVKSKAFTFGTLLSMYLLGCGIGCVIGIAIAVGVMTVQQGMLYGVSPADPVTFAATVAAFTMAALAAAAPTAWRSAHLSPVGGLKQE